MVVQIQTDRVISHYTSMYQKLYNREPREIRLLDDEWVIVNGARLRVIELISLTERMQQEYEQTIANKRSVVMKLLKWFKGT
jgi:hypothetical protein